MVPTSRQLHEVNVDDSSHPSFRHAAIGGVLRDHQGHFVCVFSSLIPSMEINSAEVFAIQRAMKITLSCNRFESAQFIVESDSKNAVRWCLEENSGPWNLNFILNFIRNTSKAGQTSSITHKKENQTS